AYVTTPAEAREMATVGTTMVTCLVTIPLLSVLPVAAVLFALRHGATTAPALAGSVAGLAGAGMAAAIYALYCTEDSPLFYVTWYALAILGVTLVSAAIGVRMLRW
ncbi:MAG: NrsF family protein, partial [Paracoccaceae bacterium]